MTDTRLDALTAGREVVIREYGECVRASLTWCERHESRVRKGMSVCDKFVSLLRLMEEVIAATAPLIRAADQESRQPPIILNMVEEVERAAMTRDRLVERAVDTWCSHYNPESYDSVRDAMEAVVDDIEPFICANERAQIAADVLKIETPLYTNKHLVAAYREALHEVAHRITKGEP